MKMNTLSKVIALIIVVAIIIFGALSYVGTRRNNSRLSNCTKKINQNAGEIEANAVLIDANTNLASKNTELISANAIVVKNNRDSIQKNSQLIEQNNSAIQTLSNAQKELRSVVTAHGYKVNRVVELIFDLAYGSDSAIGRNKWYQYTKCANKELWDEAISKLSLNHIQRLLKINNMQNETQKISNLISNLKQK